MTEKEERIEDVFQEIVEKFNTCEAFAKFARSKDGLVLSDYEVCTVQEDHRHNAEEQKIRILMKWRESKGAAATPDLIRDTCDRYCAMHPDLVQADSRPTEAGDTVIHHQAVGSINAIGNPVHITNTYITGTVTGPLVMGNESVTFNGANVSAASGVRDPDLPALKPNKTEIYPQEKQCILIGGCKVKFPQNTVTEVTQALLGYQKDSVAPPKGHIYASSTLSCTPAFQGLKNLKIILSTWCVANASVDAGIFRKDEEGNWTEIDRPILLNEGHLELQYKSLDNVTAFVSSDRIQDIQFKVSCFLFNTPDGQFAMGFCLCDKAIENEVLFRLEKDKYTRTVECLPTLTASLGDEIRFKITPGQQMQNTKFIVDEEFVSSCQGQLSTCKLDKRASSPRYIVEQVRLKDGATSTVANFSHDILGKESKREGTCGVIFEGGVEAENAFGVVKDVKIDQRSGDCGQRRPFWEDTDSVMYEEPNDKEDEAKPKKSKDDFGTGGIVFKGKVKAKNVISKADNVFIDQRRGRDDGGGTRPFMSRRKQRLEKLARAQQPEEDEDEVAQETQRAVQVEQAGHDNGARPFTDASNLKSRVKIGKDQAERTERRVFQETPSRPGNAAQPFNDQEDLKNSAKNGAERRVQREEQVMYEGTPTPTNKAVPFNDDEGLKANDGARKGMTSENMQESSSHKVSSGNPGEVDLKRRRPKDSSKTSGDAQFTETEKTSPQDDKKAKSCYDSTHAALAVGLVICLVCFLYTYFMK